LHLNSYTSKNGSNGLCLGQPNMTCSLNGYARGSGDVG
jgi:hypothetical protein